MKRKLPAHRFFRTVLCENTNLILSNKYSSLLALSSTLTLAFIIWSDFITSFKMQVCPTLCIYSVSTCYFLYGCNFILLLYFNYLKSLTGTVWSWCINDPEQLFLRMPMKPYVFLTKMFLHSQINMFLYCLFSLDWLQRRLKYIWILPC